jgi:hypothetical protein
MNTGALVYVPLSTRYIWLDRTLCRKAASLGKVMRHRDRTAKDEIAGIHDLSC